MPRFFEAGIIDFNKAVPERQPDGTVHFYDALTGSLLSIMGEKALVSRHPQEVTEIVREDGTTVFVQAGLSPTEKVLGTRSIPYSQAFAEVLCSRIAGGTSGLKKFSEEPGMPSYAVLCKWRRENKEFDEMLTKAYEDQADYRAEKIMDEIENTSADSDDIALAGLKLKAVQWTAQVNRPSKYSPRMKHSGDPLSPLQVVIETGIRREDDIGYNVDETAKLREVTPTKGAIGEIEAKGFEGVPGKSIDNEP